MTNISQIPAIRWPTNEELSQFRKSFDNRRGVLFIYREPKVAATSFAVGNGAWLRLTDSGDVIGFEIEDFEHVFLRKHPELRRSWDELKPSIIKRLKRRSDVDKVLAAFLLALKSELQRFLQQNPVQLGFV
ncbi:MAG: hypothetical protein HY532_01435 [Chloroflexi bacterium]|nr:hypothetical protein [Chloroflexota bacterium]